MAGYFEIKNVGKEGFGFNLKAGNGQVVLTSGAYPTIDAVKSAIDAVKTAAPVTDRFERKIAKNDEPYFVLKGSAGEVLGRSEMYSSASAMENGIASVARTAPDATVKTATTTTTA